MKDTQFTAKQNWKCISATNQKHLTFDTVITLMGLPQHCYILDFVHAQMYIIHGLQFVY